MALRADVGAVLARAGTARAMLQGCAEALVRHLDVAFARIWTLRPGSALLELQASAGAYTRIDGTYARVPVGELKIGQIARDRAPILTNHVLRDPRVEDRAWARRERMVSFAGYPLVVEERVVGVMAMFARRALDVATTDALASIASAVAQGIERKRSEDDLRRSEAYLAEGQRLSRTGSWGRKLATGERFWSRETFRIYGFEPAETPPPFDEILRRVHPDDVERVVRSLEEAYRTGSDLRMLTRICIPGEPTRWVDTYGHAVLGDDGTPVEFIGTIVDVTARRHASRRLRRAIRARYEAVLEERTRIARDFHDGLLQDLTGIALQLGAALPLVASEPGVARERLELLLHQIEETGREARRAVVGLRDSDQPIGLTDAVHVAARRASARAAIALSLRVSGRERPVSDAVRDAATYIVHEAATNAIRHGRARSLAVAVAYGRRRLRVAVRDDGHGLAVPAPPGPGGAHFGLVGMRERATSVGGTLTVSSTPRRGTLVRLDVALDRA